MGQAEAPVKLTLAVLAALCASTAAPAQEAPSSATPAPQVSAPQAQAAPAHVGGVIHGVIKSGATPLPGVSITATNTLTGDAYSTATNVSGEYRMTIPANGRYVLKTEFAAFGATTGEALLNNNSHDQAVDLTLVLASRVQALPADRGELGSVRPTAGSGQSRGARQYAGGSQALGLLSSAISGMDAGTSETATQLPTLAGNSDFSNDSVAVAGQSGTTNAFAGINLDELRQRAENDPSLAGGAAGGGGGPGGGGFGGGGFGGGGGGFGGRGGGNFRHFNPNQPHGALFWTGGNSALNAKDFAIRGQQFSQPAYATNRFGATFAGAPYIPRLIEHDKKDYLFFTLSGQRSSNPFDQYGTVPTLAERGGDLSSLTTPSGTPVTIYEPGTNTPFPNNQVPVIPQAAALLNYIPLPNLSGTTENFQRVTTSGTNNTVVGLRFIRTIGDSSGSPLVGLVRQYMGQSKGLQQNIHANFNYVHTASDAVNLFPELGGKQQTYQYSLDLGYTVSRGRLTNNFDLNWNQTQSQLTNYFTNKTDIASEIGLSIFGGVAADPANFGLPNITLNQFNGLSEQQPAIQTNQTLAGSESGSWSHSHHNVKWGADYKRVELNLIGNTNSTGTFYFTGFATEAPGSSSLNGVGSTGQSGVPQTGSSLADFLLGLPQETSLQAPYQKAYLRENVYDAYVQDDWRVLPSLTLLAGLRYEYFSPYSEKDDRLATLDPGNDFASVATVEANGVGPYTGRYPRTLIERERGNVSPRVGFAWRALKNTVVRGGYGINFTNGQYAKFVQQFAFQPPFADVQTNEVTENASITLANGFPAPQTIGNYSVNKDYKLPYVQVWNLDIQRTLPLNIVLNVGWNGSKGTRLDIVDAPGRSATASLSGVLYDYEDSVAFSNFNALAVRLRKRLQRGIAVGATYTYSHSIDDATSVGGVGNAVAQNWQDLLAEESNSSFDIRHSLKGDFVYELPFGPDKSYLTAGRAAHFVEGVSLSGTFAFASGAPLSPHYEASVTDVARGSAGSLRPDRVPGVSLDAGSRSLRSWFNRAAFTQPANVYGDASRYSIEGPGTVSFNSSLSKTISLKDTKSFEMRATASNVFNTVQYSGVDTTLGSGTYGEVTSAAAMRAFSLLARYRF